jgi:hypothetical protein
MNPRKREIERLRQQIPPPAGIRAADLARWQDLPTFLESDYYIPDDETPAGKKRLVLEPHQRVILRHLFQRDVDGRFRYRTLIYCRFAHFHGGMKETAVSRVYTSRGSSNK